jgi:hypothetical protein
MAPLTRQRSPNHVPTELVGEYYEQRASQGGLLISEGTLISPMVHPLKSVLTAGRIVPQRPWNLDRRTSKSMETHRRPRPCKGRNLLLPIMARRTRYFA